MKWYEWGPIAWLREYLNTHPRAEELLTEITIPPEVVLKKSLFRCQSCGQCLLHENGIMCPMRCPKTSRNGPCGGVRANGHCEVYPERWCIWYRAYYRSQKMPLSSWREDMFHIHPPVNWRLVGTSSFVNLITGRDHGVPSKSPAKKPATPKSTKT